MRDIQPTKFGSELPKTIIGIIIWLGIGFLVLNTVGERRILECNRQSNVVKCNLVTKRLLGEEQVAAFNRATLQNATLAVKKGFKLRDTTYESTLVTSNGNFWMSATDNVQVDEKQHIVDRINAFLKYSNTLTLKVETRYNSIFWIVAVIFLLGLSLLIFSLYVSIKFPNISPSRLASEPLKESWGAKLENSDKELKRKY